MNSAVSGVITVATAIVGVAILAVLVSRNAQTSSVLKSAGGAFSQAIGAAVSPVTGGGGNGNGFLSPTSFSTLGGVGDVNYY